METPVSVNGRLMPAEHYLLDALGLYVVGVSESKTCHHKAVAQRIALVANSGAIKLKSDAVDGRETGEFCAGECAGVI